MDRIQGMDLLIWYDSSYVISITLESLDVESRATEDVV